MSKMAKAFRLVAQGNKMSDKIKVIPPGDEHLLPPSGPVIFAVGALYGYCPRCSAPGVMRERRPNGNDRCQHGHSYPSMSALPARQ